MANVVQSENSLEVHYKHYRSRTITFLVLWILSFLLFLPTRGLSAPFAIGFFIAFAYYSRKAGILKAGVTGEKQAQCLFASLPSGYTVLSDVTVSVEGKQSQIDTVIVGNTGVFLVEVKNLNGFIEGRHEDRELIQHKTGRKGGAYSKNFYNPIKQVGTHVYRLKTLLRERGLTTWVQGVVYFSNPQAEVVVHNDGKIPLFSKHDGGDKEMLDYIMNAESSLDGRTQEQIVGLLKQHIKGTMPN